MNTNPPLYDYVMAQLASRRLSREIVAAESGVPYSTVNKIAQKRIKDPSVHTIQRLANYFLSKAEGGTTPAAFTKAAARRSTDRPKRRKADLVSVPIDHQSQLPLDADLMHGVAIKQERRKVGA